MALGQKLQDIRLHISGSRRAKFWLIAPAVVLIFMYFLSGPRTPDRRFAPPKGQKTAESRISPGASDSTQDLITSFQRQVDEIKKANEQQAEEVKATKKTLTDYEQRTAEILKKMLQRMSETQANDPAVNQGVQAAAAPQELQNEIPSSGQQQGGELSIDGQPKEQSLESFGLEEKEVAPPPPSPVLRTAVVGPGDSVRVKLLAGVNAPTDGTPYPVVFQLVGDVYGPDGSTLPLGEGRLVAAAQGSLTDSRALFRLTTLNIQLPSGERKIYPVDGWIVGEDGIRGMQGILIDPIGKAIGGAAIAGGLAGIGSGVSSSNTRVRADPNGGITTMVDGDVGAYAAGRALQQGSNEWSSIIRERLAMMVPVVKVYSGREGTAVFAKTLPVDGVIEAYSEEEGSGTGLD